MQEQNEPLFGSENLNGDSLSNKKVLSREEIYYDKRIDRINLGSRLYNFKNIIDVNGEMSPVHECYIVTLTFDTKVEDVFYLNTEAFTKFQYCYAEHKAKMKFRAKSDRSQFDKDWDTFSNKNKEFTLFRIKKEFIILYIILILGFLKCNGMEIVNEASNGEFINGKFVENEIKKELPKDQIEQFPYTYIYDVNIDKCVSIDYYKHKFSYNDLKNPKLVMEFPQRPNELILVLQNGEMYVFTKDEESCKAYKKRFIEDLIKQNRLEENKYNIED